MVEISAAGAAAEPELPHEALGELRSAGVRVALDDVTSLEQLERTRGVRWDYVKLGRAVIGAAARDPDTAALARSLVEAVRPSGARLAAVGVEDDAALAMARDLGCYLAQGYQIIHSEMGNPFLQFLLKKDNTVIWCAVLLQNGETSSCRTLK